MREHAQVDHRRARARLDDAPEHEEDDGEREDAEEERRPPAPVLALGQREHQRDQPAGEEQRARHVDLRRRADRRLGHVAGDEDERERDRDRAEQEEVAPGEVVDDQPGEHDPEAAADAPDRREQADPDLHLLGRELVADDREAEREERAAGARDDPERDQRPEAPGERSAETAGEEEPEADQQQPLLAELVAEAAEDRRQHRPRDEEAGQDPRRPGRARAERVLERAERREDHRLLERERRAGQGQDRQRDVVMLAGEVHRRTLAAPPRCPRGWTEFHS